MKVLERGFSLNVFPDFASIGIGQETNLNLQFQYFDNTLLTPEVRLFLNVPSNIILYTIIPLVFVELHVIRSIAGSM